ncbi:hypothetical protein SAMN06297468_2100 [Altererythrobacter xiamenensis]|uniref:DUF5681 domain-containing protein n=1 Tax=Altererythrobacter xiamenensis TaxID=1316679 RepID=A0A1Y6F543_9SPHN|nr:DUF5681 domain-containing protein [Altererythrobacter xiamenensis]SMQ69917.1 hypothetical protein SAMN06297468_2100 [Altererythrobacter xiamenensis]
MAKTPKKKSSKWGKGKTDPATWWKKGGPSPNPKGRPKGSKNQKTLWKEAVQKKITVNFDGETQKMTKQELTYHQLAQKAASGDLKAIAMLLNLDEKFDPGETIPPTKAESAADFDTLEEWLKLKEKFKAFKQSDEEDDHG